MVDGNIARARLIKLAQDVTSDKTERTIAISMIGQDGSRDSIVAILKILLHEQDRQLRTGAFYALPEKYRPAKFDTTSDRLPDNVRMKILARIAALQDE